MWSPRYSRQEKYYLKNRERLNIQGRILSKQYRKEHQKIKRSAEETREIVKNIRIRFREYLLKKYNIFFTGNGELISKPRSAYKENTLKKNMRQRRRMYLKRGADGSHTVEEWELKKKEFLYHCVRCKGVEPFEDQYFKQLTEDHIIPITKGGSNYISNIQPLCHRCNVGKGNSLK